MFLTLPSFRESPPCQESMLTDQNHLWGPAVILVEGKKTNFQNLFSSFCHCKLCQAVKRLQIFRTASSSSSYPPVQDFVLHNENFVDNMSRGGGLGAEDRSQKLLTNTKKVRGLRSFLWIKPNSSSSQTAFLCQVHLPFDICNDDGPACVSFGFGPPWLDTKLKLLCKLHWVD